MTRLLFLAGLLLAGGAATAAPKALPAGDPFAAYLDRQPPRIVREVPEPADAGRQGVAVRRVVFLSRTVQTPDGPRASEVYAVIARPAAPGPYPGILVLHGGAGCAEAEKAIAWAARGYIAVAPDLPGIADPKKLAHSNGPWKVAYGQNRWTAKPDITASTIFDGVLAAMQSLYLLRAQPDVILDRVGVVGISWGGYATTMVCSLAGADVRAGFSVFGCGFYEHCVAGAALQRMPEDERALWFRHLDAGRRAGAMKAAYFVAAATNDFFFWPPAVTATLKAIPGERNHLFAPNVTHKAPVPGGTDGAGPANWLKMEVEYFAWHLKAEGRPLPRVGIEPVSEAEALAPDGGIRVRFTVQSPAPVAAAQVWYSLPGEPWTKRVWTACPARDLGAGFYEAPLPADAKAADWFALVSDDRAVTVSSEMVGGEMGQ